VSEPNDPVDTLAPTALMAHSALELKFRLVLVFTGIEFSKEQELDWIQEVPQWPTWMNPGLPHPFTNDFHRETFCRGLRLSYDL
jgi:hypothetical protein